MKYEAALAVLQGKMKVKVGPNVHLVKNGDSVGVKLYDTYVVSINQNGTYRIDSGGFPSATTKRWINKFSPADIHSVKKVWYCGEQPFFDGAILNKDGRVLNARHTEKDF